MKKRWLLLMSLALVLILQLVLPGVISAATPKKNAQAFQASGLVYISGPYESRQVGRFEFARNEPVDTVPGTALVSDWAAINGGSFKSLHDGMIAFKPDGTFEGRLNGDFTITTADGRSKLEGKMEGKVSGTWNPLDPLNRAGTYLDDAGSFRSTKGTGIFAGIKAEGAWQAHLEWDAILGTYIGPISIQGKQVQLPRGDREDDRD